MKTIIVNFKNKTGVESVIDTLNLEKYPLNLQEFSVVEFFGDFQNAIMELKES
ncbi:hypothetical protein [Helicobacter apodemus]|uniref:hypothetical protein n=1 Tax=Helicobacter apodemus TaxID=135569 RepID=UPI000AFC33E0|nr:hypothetical protein [Helicobacter apodemus]